MKLQIYLKLLNTKNANVPDVFNNNYVAINKKISTAIDVIKNSYYENNKFKIDSIKKYIYSCMSLVDLYTSLEYEKSPDKIFDEFDKLNSIGFFEVLFEKIDEREMKEYNMILEMTASDAVANEEMK